MHGKKAYTKLTTTARSSNVYAVASPADMQRSIADDHTFYGGTLLVDIGSLGRPSLLHVERGRN